MWNLAGVVLILLLERLTRLGWGRTFAIYLIWYGLGRSGLEAIRINPTSDAPLGIPANIWTSFAAVLLGVAALVVQSIRHRTHERSPYRDGSQPSDRHGVAAADENVSA